MQYCEIRRESRVQQMTHEHPQTSTKAAGLTGILELQLKMRDT